jgi:hypothetical protein
MRASEELAKRQREYPLSAADRGAALFSRMVPLPDQQLESLRRSQALVVGEVNRPLPNAKTFHYLDGSHAIMLFSGLLDFFSSAAKILLGGSHMHRDGKVEDPSLFARRRYRQTAGAFRALDARGNCCRQKHR